MATHWRVIQTASVRWLRCALVLVSSMLSLACGKPTPARSAPLELRFSGCAEWLRDRTCELASQRTLTFWIAGAASDAMQVSIDGQTVNAERAQVEGGVRLRVEVPRRALRLAVRKGGRSFHAALRDSAPASVLERARALRAEGHYAEARALLTPLYESSDPKLKAHARGLLARLYLSEGDAERALTALEDASDCARKAGLVSAEAANYVARADVLKRLRWDLAGAHEALSRIPPEAHEFVLSGLQMRASLALVSGDLRSALTLARAAVRDAERLSLASLGTLARHVELLSLAELGRLSEARTVHAQILGHASNPCERGRAMTNGSWLELVAGGDAQRAYAQAQQAVRQFSGACKDGWEEQNARVNLALAAFKLERLAEARTELARAAALGEPQGWVRAWQDELDAELDLREGKLERAIARFEALAEREGQGGPVASQFRAQLGLGRALLAHGDERAAERALRRAEERLDLEVRTAPLGASRDAFSASRAASAALLVDLLIDAKRADEALEVARRARVRPLQGFSLRGRVENASGERRAGWDRALSAYQRAREALDELHRAAWRIPVAEQAAHDEAQRRLEEQMMQALDAAYAQVDVADWTLTPALPGVLDLYFFSTERGHVAFARSTRGVTALRLPMDRDAEPDELAKTAVAAFAERMREVSELRVVPHGVLRGVDFQALPFEHGLLIDRVSVRYGIDVQADSDPDAAIANTALLVFDPHLDLPGARREGIWLRERLREDYGAVIALTGREATLSRTREALQRASWAHFAGHGKAVSTSVGLSAELSLADHAVLEAGDILALARVPETIVLAGCETGVDNEQAAFGWGMAQAFVVRGATGVLATQRAVSDAAAASFVRKFYENRADSLALRAHDAIRALRDEGVGDWRAFRLYTR